MGGDLRLRFDASPGHSSFIFFYNQQFITIQPENQTVRSVSPLVGRSVREPPQDGSEYKTIELIALRLRDAWVGESYLRLQTMGSLNSGGNSGETMWVSTDAARPRAVSQKPLYELTVADRRSAIGCKSRIPGPTDVRLKRQRRTSCRFWFIPGDLNG